MKHEHYHEDEQGYLVKCYHVCKHWLSPGFLAGWWIANTLTFPLEHLQWDHIWPFDYVGAWLDSTGHLQMWISYVWLVFFLVSAIVGIMWAVKHRHDSS